MLTDSQKVDVRRWLGYPTLNTGTTDYVYSAYGVYGTVSLDHKLDALTVSEGSVLIATFLTVLATLESAIPASADNMDTQSAGPWTSNPREMAQRTALFNKWRRDMAAFLGFAPGPGLGAGGMTLVRA